MISNKDLLDVEEDPVIVVFQDSQTIPNSYNRIKFGRMMKLRRTGYPFILVSIALILLPSGCLDPNNDDQKKEDELELITDDMVVTGHIDHSAQSSPISFTEEVHFEVMSGSITRIRINVSIDDGDANTENDVVDVIRMWREAGGDPEKVKDANGGATPYQTSIEFEYKGEETEADWWIVEISATIKGSEDQWPGPLIWRGVADTGLDYQIDADYDYY